MAERNRIVRALVALALVVAPGSIRAAESAAIVTEVRGDARLGNGSRVELLGEVPAGTEMRLQASARVVLIHLGAGTTFVLGGPGTFAIRAGAVESVDGARVLRTKALPPAFRDVRLQPARVTQASVAMRGSSGDERLRLVGPVATWLLEWPGALTWELRSGAVETPYAVQITDTENRVVFEAATRESSLPLPASVRLEPGRLYGWQVTATVDGKRVEAWTEFGIADAALRARAESAHPGPEAAEGDRVTYALLLEALNLREAAREQWLHVWRGRPDDARLRALAKPH